MSAAADMAAVHDIALSPKLTAQMDQLHASILRVKAERDQYREALLDIVMGADMMLQPVMNLTGAFRSYVLEVKRVATENLK